MLFLAAVMFSLSLFSQPVESGDLNYLMYNKQRIREIEFKDISGHPYSNRELLPGSVIFVSGAQYDSIPMRYNWYANVMEFKPEEELLVMPQAGNIVAVVIDSVRYVPFYNQKSIKGYLVELCRGNYSLFKKEEVIFFDPKPAQSGYEGAQPARFEWSNPSYIVVSDEGALFRLDLNKKKMPQQFPGYEEKISSFLSENKINLKKEEDLISLIRKINSWDAGPDRTD